MLNTLKKKTEGKKGFTLIEMLVVIAIIAVLVAIIIPTVTSATTKAAAATNAANLRSVYAEYQTEILSGAENSEGYCAVDASGNVTLIEANCPTSKACGSNGSYIGKGVKMTIDTTNKTITYGTGKTIEYFAGIAETGKAS